MARKKYSEQVQNDYDSYASEVNDARQKAIEGMTTAGEQQMADLAAAEQARQTAYNDAQKMYQQRMNEGYTSFADIVAGDNARIRQAEQENAMQVAADRRAARWTGATELASSLANLIAVGGYNAVSQQYRPYSQDWMRKADMDARMNRARIDNLRERQKAMQAQLAQLKMGDAGRALQMAQEQAKNTYQHNLATAQARYNTTVNPLNEAAKAAEEVGKIRTQGSVQAANVGLHEQQLAQTAAHQNATLKQREKEHAAAMLAKGYNPDGTINEEAMGRLVAVSAAKGGKGNKSELTIDLLEHNGLPAETITVPDEATLRTTLFSNIDAVTDLSKEQRDAIISLMEDDSVDAKKKAEQLGRYLVSSDQLRSLFRERGLLKVKRANTDDDVSGQKPFVKPSERTSGKPSSDDPYESIFG